MLSQCRSFVRARILDVLGYSATPANGVHILNGHRISLHNPNPQIFGNILTLLSKEVSFIRFEEAVELIKQGKQVDSPLVAFSFDDGFEECYTMIAPILEEFKTNAAFFINPNFVSGDDAYIHDFTENIVLTPDKRPMRWPQILELQKKGHIIGAHTLDHYMINTNSEKDLDFQIGRCKTVIEEHTHESCNYFAFPYGRLEHASLASIEIALKYYPYVFSQSDYKKYYSFGGRVINRRHFEPDWPIKHINYFISHQKKY